MDFKKSFVNLSHPAPLFSPYPIPSSSHSSPHLFISLLPFPSLFLNLSPSSFSTPSPLFSLSSSVELNLLACYIHTHNSWSLLLLLLLLSTLPPLFFVRRFSSSTCCYKFFFSGLCVCVLWVMSKSAFLSVTKRLLVVVVGRDSY